MLDYFLNQPTNIIPKGLTSSILENEDAFPFHKSLSNYKPTPLYRLTDLANSYGVGSIFIKDESHRLGLNAFKGLGASFAVHKVLEKNPKVTTFCTATDGNHGRALAWAASIKGKNAVVYVPKNTTKERIDNIASEGATVVDTGENYDDTCEIAKISAIKNNWTLVQDCAWEGYEEIPAYVMAGYLTEFKEIEMQWKEFDSPKINLVLFQAGVGSWAASGIWHFINQHRRDRPKFVIVEPYNAHGILSSFHEGKRVQPKCNFDTIMAGLNCGLPSMTAWEIIRNFTDACIRIKDEYAKEVMRELYHPSNDDPRIISGESGVGGLAGLKYLMTNPQAEPLKQHLGITASANVLVVSTEGATDKEMFQKIVRKI